MLRVRRFDGADQLTSCELSFLTLGVGPPRGSLSRRCSREPGRPASDPNEDARLLQSAHAVRPTSLFVVSNTQDNDSGRCLVWAFTAAGRSSCRGRRPHPPCWRAGGDEVADGEEHREEGEPARARWEGEGVVCAGRRGSGMHPGCMGVCEAGRGFARTSSQRWRCRSPCQSRLRRCRTSPQRRARCRAQSRQWTGRRMREIREIRIRTRLSHCKFCPCDAQQHPRISIIRSRDGQSRLRQTP